MARRRKKSSPLVPLFLWACALGLIGWGAWQANQIWKSVVTDPVPASTQPVDTTTVAARTSTVDFWSGPDGEIKTTLEEIETTRAVMDPAETQPLESARLQSGPTFPAELSADELATQGHQLLESGHVVQARYALNAALERAKEEPQRQPLRELMASINRPIFFESAVLPEDPAVRFVDIREGDNFTKLAKEFGVPSAFLESINPTLNPKNLKIGLGVKIVQGPFAVRIYKQAKRLDLYARELYITSLTVDFPEGNSLPVGDFRVAAGTKLQLTGPGKTWIGFEGMDDDTRNVTAGWIFGTAGPRGIGSRDRSTGIHLTDSDLSLLYNVLTEGKSHLRVEP